MTELEAALKQRQDKFVETRTIISSEVTKFLNSVNSLPEDVKQKIVFPYGSTAQEILPALWIEPFDMEAYTVQLDSLNKTISEVVAYCDELDRRAIECLKLQQ